MENFKLANNPFPTAVQLLETTLVRTKAVQLLETTLVRTKAGTVPGKARGKNCASFRDQPLWRFKCFLQPAPGEPRQ